MMTADVYISNAECQGAYIAVVNDDAGAVKTIGSHTVILVGNAQIPQSLGHFVVHL